MQIRSLGLSCLFAVAAIAQDVPSRIAAHVRAEDLKADVAFLASDTLQGRATPSPGLDAAAEYIASQFRKAGLEPVGDDGYFQSATYQLVTPNLDGFSLTVGTARLDALVLNAATTDLQNADVVTVQTEGLAALTAEQVRGKVLVVESSGGVRAGNMERLEPALVILALPNLPRAAGSRPSLRETTAPQQKFATLIVSAAALKQAMPATDAKISAHIAAPKTDTAKVRNVVGLLRGADPALKDTYVLLTGHYDHLGVRAAGEGDRIFNGANDDASGTSSVIEIAAALSALGAKPKRSILFMTVFGEEIGGYGARYYTSHPIFPLAKTVADINLEQLGRTDDDEGPRVGAFNLTGFDYTDIAAIMAKAGEQTGIKVEKHPANSDAFFRRSDNATFADAGIPSTTISVAYVYPDYHGVGDEWPKLDYQNMAKVDDCIALALWDIANREKVPEWNRENPHTARFLEAQGKLK